MLQFPLSQEVCPDTKITVVYNALLWPDNDWRLIIRGQLNDLVKSGLPDCADVHVALSAPASHGNWTYATLVELMEEGASLVHSVPHGGRLNVIRHHDNMMEYPGLHTLWQLAQDDPVEAATSHLFLYLHTKGMVHHGHLSSRIDNRLFNAVVAEWRWCVCLAAFCGVE